MQKVVAVDIGNSSLKVAVCSNETVTRIDSNLSDEQLAAGLATAVAELGQPVRWLVCSVDRQQTSRLKAWVARHRSDDVFDVIAADDIDLESAVTDREALGRDRLLGAWYGSTRSAKGKNTIVIDGGTAVTIDVVVAKQGHIGGLIFPSANSSLAALAANTDALPDLSKASPPELNPQVQLGDSTEPAILLGMHQLQRFGLIAMVQALEEQFADAEVWCCGGAFESGSCSLPDDWQYEHDFLISAIFHLDRVS